MGATSGAGGGRGTVNPPRLLGLNEKCVDSSGGSLQCASGLACDDVGLYTCQVTIGNSCKKDTDCMTLNYCDGVCKLQKEDGVVCSRDEECNKYGFSKCLAGRSGTKICTEGVNVCKSDNECGDSRYCDGSCKYIKDSGVVCSRDEECSRLGYSKCLSGRSGTKICTPVN